MLNEQVDKLIGPPGLPMFCKSRLAGSSTALRYREEPAALELAGEQGERIPNRERALRNGDYVPVINRPTALPIVEIVTGDEFWH